MRVTRVYVDAPLTTGSRVTLQGAAASHVTRVLRLRVGEALTVFNGSGGEYAASIEHARGGTVAVAIGEAPATRRESPPTLILPPGVARGERPGPEGGLAEAEQEAAVAAGFTPVRLGPRVLRTETAAIAALTLLQREFGDL